MNEQDQQTTSDFQANQDYGLRMAAYMQSEYYRRDCAIAEYYDRIRNKRELSITLHKRSGAQLPYNIKYENEQKAIIEVAVAGYTRKDIRIHESSDFISVSTAYASSGINHANEPKEFLHYNRGGFPNIGNGHDQEFYVYKGITDKEFNMDFFVPRNHVSPHFLMDEGILRISFDINEVSNESKTYYLTNTGCHEEGYDGDDEKLPDNFVPKTRSSKRLVTNRGPRTGGIIR